MREIRVQDVLSYIDAQAATFVADLQALLRRPSISAQGVGLDECAELLLGQLQRYGVTQARRMPTAGGPDIVYGEVAAAAPAPTLLCYGHYDVQPAEPLDRWLAPPFAAELARKPVTILIGAGLSATLAAKAATTTIPIVFFIGEDPIRLGLVASLNQPGGNITGVTTSNTEVGPKRLQLIRELVPSARVVVPSRSW